MPEPAVGVPEVDAGDVVGVHLERPAVLDRPTVRALGGAVGVERRSVVAAPVDLGAVVLDRAPLRLQELKGEVRVSWRLDVAGPRHAVLEHLCRGHPQSGQAQIDEAGMGPGPASPGPAAGTRAPDPRPRRRRPAPSWGSRARARPHASASLSRRPGSERLVEHRADVHCLRRHRREPDPGDAAGVPIHADRELGLDPSQRQRVECEHVQPCGVHQQVLAWPGRPQLAISAVRPVGDVPVPLGAEPEQWVTPLQLHEHPVCRGLAGLGWAGLG
ncbi:hypothetical protein YW7DRAFT_01293 [Streptomyces sp. AmelKG-E11A]|nr:hypothetical protein YW7DRAFT_01293 [Streptomyces sp. AmelKG-E11A]